MPREKVTLTRSTDKVNELRKLVGARSLSAAVDQAVARHVERLRHPAAVDGWLAELESQHGPIPSETVEWAAKLVDDWDSARRTRTRRAS